MQSPTKPIKRRNATNKKIGDAGHYDVRTELFTD